jgi:1,4-alpha-glucan branching enzyme
MFQGQEYGEENPFQFFTDYGDPVLQKAVSEGRRSEFKDFDFSEVPDPQHPQTFERSRLTWANEEHHCDMLEWYKKLLLIRREIVLKSERTCRAEWIDDRTLKMQVPAENPRLLLSAGLGCELRYLPGAGWELLAESSEDDYCMRIWQRAPLSL